MCGIFGAIGTKWNKGVIRALALVNRERGEDSLGFFDSMGRIIKRACDPIRLLSADKMDAWLENAYKGAWFVAGHTRFATYGKIINRNAHPFKYGNIVGAHNGQVEVPVGSYGVDSEMLFDRLWQHKGNYQTALADVQGYWGLSWFDGRHFYLQAHNHSLAVGKSPAGIWYYSSDPEHLRAAVGKVSNLVELGRGDTFRFTRGNPAYEIMPSFVGLPRKEKRFVWKANDNWMYNKASSGKASSGKASSGKASKLADDDAEKVYSDIDDFDLECADSLAREQGYAGLIDFMGQEGYRTANAAIDALETLPIYHWQGEERLR